MTRYLLDTNIISDSTKPKPNPGVAAWFAAQATEDLFISTQSLGEIWRGILRLPEGAKKARLTSWFGGPNGVMSIFAGRILTFDYASSLEWGRLMAMADDTGTARDPLDCFIEAIASAHRCVVVTHNVKHFSSGAFFDPFT